MANNVAVTAGSGTSVATDDVGGVHYQVVKLAAGDEDSSARIGGDASNGLDVDVTRLPALAAGTNAIGKLAANSGIDIGDVDVTSVVPGVAATSLGKAEDAAHTSGDTGVMALVVRKDAATALAGTDGDYAPLQVDANGALRVVGGTSSTQYAEDAAHASGDTGTMALAVRNDAGTVLAGTTGDYIPLTTDSSGNLRSLVSGTVALSATEVHVGQVGGTTQIVQVTPTVSTTPAYTAGDIIGGIMTFTNALRITSGTGAILSVNVTEVGTQKAAIDLILFNASPTGGTYTDNGAPTWDTSDYNRVLGVVHILSTDYTTYGAISVATVRNQPVGVWGNSVANIYGVMVAVGTPTYSATSSLRVTLTTLAD